MSTLMVEESDEYNYAYEYISKRWVWVHC